MRNFFKRITASHEVPIPPSGPQVPVKTAWGGDLDARHLTLALEPMKTLFGRLAYVASLWNPDAHFYRFSALVTPTGSGAMDTRLRLLHLEIFRQWLSLNPRQQRGDLMLYLGADVASSRSLVRSMCENGIIRSLTPASAPEDEREAFERSVVSAVSG